MDTTNALQPGTGMADTTARSGLDWVHRMASVAHRGIDRVERSLNSATGMPREQADKAREYMGQVRERAAAQPARAAALVFASGFVFSRLFMRKPKPRVVRVYVRERSSALGSRGRDAQGVMRATGRSMERVGRGAQDLMGSLGAMALKGMGAARALSATLPHQARAMTHNLRSATRSTRSSAQAYGEKARSSMQAHPMVGTGVALGAGALLASQLMPHGQQERSLFSQPDASFLSRGASSDQQAGGATEGPFRFGHGPSTRTLMLSGAGLGLAVLLGAALLRR